jgi:hypothetical protein
MFWLLLLLLPGPAWAQVPKEYVDKPIPEYVREAFAGRYGRMMVKEGARVALANADPACLRERNIDPAGMEARMEALYVRSATRRLEILNGFVDGQKFEAAVAERAGPRTKEDYQRLRQDPEVRKYLALAYRQRYASLVDESVETIARHLVISGVRGASDLSPLSSGNQALLDAGEEETDIEAKEQFANASRSPAVRRWRELERAITESTRAAMEETTLLRYGPRQYTPDAGKDFAELCVTAR